VQCRSNPYVELSLIETHDVDTYAGHFNLRLVELTPTRLAFAG
jgi:hypothetical protein